MSAAAIEQDVLAGIDPDATPPCRHDEHDVAPPATHRLRVHDPCCGTVQSALLCTPHTERILAAWADFVRRSLGALTVRCTGCGSAMIPKFDQVTATPLGGAS